MKALRLLTAAGAVILSLTAALPGSADAAGRSPAQASQTGCAGANSATQDARFARAILCLHNVERRKHGLSSLSRNSNLSRAAARHARDMVRRHYFDHDSPGGKDHMDRLSAVGYGASAGCWSAGENLLSSRARATPRQVLSAWMSSVGHRRNILGKRWHEFGLGIVARSPSGGRGGITIVALFGTHTKRPCS